MVKETDSFGKMISTALRDEAAVCHLPDDFALRLGRRLEAGDAGMSRAWPRWTKVAASLAAMAAFSGFAAWLGVAVYEAILEEGAHSVATERLVDPETEMISNQGDETMIARKMAGLVGAAMVSVAVPAAELTSEPTFVFLRPETSSFWNTATNSTMTVTVDFPMNAREATLLVEGLDYQKAYSDIADGSFTFELPQPTSPETENVYTLTLSFDDGTVRTAKLGLIQGLSPDAEGMTRCLAPSTAKVWDKVKGRAVLPIPYGTTSFTVDGIETDPGLKGAQGWYALGGLTGGKNVSLSLVADGVQHLASLVGGPCGFLLMFR